MWIFIEPSDVWLFRDGRPFDAGSDHRANSLFPPAPTTVQGAIRTEILSLYGVDPGDYVRGECDQQDLIAQIGAPPGTADGDGGTMRLQGPFLARRESGGVMPYFPCPADLLQIEKPERKQLVKLSPQTSPPFAANWPDDGLRPLSFAADTVGDETPAGIQAWISATALGRYLAGRISERNCPAGAESETAQAIEDAEEFAHLHLLRPGALFTVEPRLGIGVDGDDKRPEDGLLYQVSTVRPRDDVGLLVQISGIDEAQWPQRGMLRLGGEMRAAQYEVLSQPADWPQRADGGRKLYFATPTCFDGGWRPDSWTPFFGSEPALTAATVHRHQLVGGWDMARRRPKPMLRYVPAGAVYYFETPIQSELDTICDDEAAGRIGFGAYFIGRW